MYKRSRWSWTVPVAMAALLAVACAHAVDPRPGYGPGMTGGYGMGPGMMGGYGRGAMGGYGPGDGDGGYGPGMMGGYGMGPGMMGGYGPGPGMGAGMGAGMGLGPIWALELNENQRRSIDNIMAEQHKQQSTAMSAMIGTQARLRELQLAEKWDEKAIGGVYEEMFKQQRLMIESSIRVRNRIQDQLTAEQKEQLRRWSWGEQWGR